MKEKMAEILTALLWTALMLLIFVALGYSVVNGLGGKAL